MRRDSVEGEEGADLVSQQQLIYLREMSRNDRADDDFFGIEYTSSYDVTTDEKSRPIADSPSPVSAPISTARRVTVAADRQLQQEPKKLSGTEFLDESFFPGLEERKAAGDHAHSGHAPLGSHNEDSAFHEFDQQYFGRQSRENAERGQAHLDMLSEPRSNRNDDVMQKKTREKRKKRVRDDEPDRFRAMQDESDSVEGGPAGLVDLRSQLLPIWTMDDVTLREEMVRRVVYADANVIAFDKPFGLPYSGGPAHRPQFDRLLQSIKALVAPKVERLHLVRSIDKHQSGVIMFATNKLLQTSLRDQMDKGLVENVHRCIVRGRFKDSQFDIDIPLVKMVSEGNMKLMPLLSNDTKQPISYGKSRVTVLNGSETASHVEVTTTNEIAHQVRSHLSLAGCPLIGDGKYGNNHGRPPRLSNVVMNRLDMSINQAKKIPIYSHLKEVRLPSISGAAPITIQAPSPAHFIWMLRKLRIIKR